MCASTGVAGRLHFSHIQQVRNWLSSLQKYSAFGSSEPRGDTAPDLRPHRQVLDSLLFCCIVSPFPRHFAAQPNFRNRPSVNLVIHYYFCTWNWFRNKNLSCYGTYINIIDDFIGAILRRGVLENRVSVMSRLMTQVRIWSWERKFRISLCLLHRSVYLAYSLYDEIVANTYSLRCAIVLRSGKN